MTDHGDQLREAFKTHENLAPDPAVVYARVQELSRSYLWRRRGAQVAGGAVLGAGLIAGAINLPALPGAPNDNVAVGTPAWEVGAPAPSSAPLVSPSAAPPGLPQPAVSSPSLSRKEQALEKQWDAYFGAGYDYDDAVLLARMWKSDDEIGDVKAEAGRRLLAGDTLPIEPGEGRPAPGEPSSDPGDGDTAALDAFYGAGYDYDDAVRLARLWKTADPFGAKIEGGKRILAGESLPFRA